MSLYQKVRPTTLDEIAGARNREVVATLRSLLRSPDPPHAMLFVGESGCGKTTLGRIAMRELGVADEDFREIDTATFRGIDSVREMRRQAEYRGIKGTRRGWLLDECFAGGTRVSTTAGEVLIESIKPGDYIYSLAGPSRVVNVFRNVVFLDRILRLRLSNGHVVFTTVDHLFFLGSRRWARAGSLAVGDLLFGLSGNMMFIGDLAGGRRVPRAAAGLSGMRDDVQEEATESGLLLAPVRVGAGSQVEAACSGGGLDLRGMRRIVYSQDEQADYQVLLRGMCPQARWPRTHQAAAASPVRDLRCPGYVLSGSEGQQGDVQPRLREYSGGTEAVRSETVGTISSEVLGVAAARARSEHGAWPTPASGLLGQDEGEQSVPQARRRGEGQDHEADQGYAARLGWRARGEREVDDAAEAVVGGLGVADGGVYSHGMRSSSGRRFSDLLQGGYRQSGVEDCHRGRRQGTLDGAQSQAGREEDAEAGGVRVEGVEVYQRGRNDEHFRGVVGDRERGRGYAIFYDLEVEDHPSYFAEGVAVHNCHRWTPDSQEAMLKGLEDPPPHVYYALCTTNPDKLLKTILTRCTQFRVHPLDEDEMVRLLRRVASGEGAEVPRAALQKIAEASGGSARTALNALQKMIADPEAGEAAMATAELTEARALDLFRALIGNRGWRAVRATLADLKASGEDPEGIRRYVLACCSNELLRSDEGDRAAVILDEFREPLYSTGFPGLVFAAYSAVRQG